MTGFETLDSTTEDDLPRDEIVELAVVEDDLEDERPDAIYHVILLAVCLTVVVLAMLLTVRDEQFVVIPYLNIPLPETCSFKRMVGLDCPGCGLTRCFINLGHGNIQQAVHFNPVGILFFGVVLFQIPYRLLQIVRHRQRRPEIRLGKFGFWALGLVAAGLVVQWIIKMILFLVSR